MKAPSSIAIPLSRRGAWLCAEKLGSWQMQSVEGPLFCPDPARQLFRVETSGREVLLISRRVGERGMRELNLESILFPKNPSPAPDF